MELLMAFWKMVFEKANEVVSKIRGAFSEDSDEPTPPAQGPYRKEPEPEPVETKPTAMVKADDLKSVPSGEEKPKLLKDGSKLVCTLTNEDSKSKAEITKIKAKTRRRAIRHFEGKEVKHRVTEKKPDSIEFAFFRRSGKPVKVRWQKIGARAEQTPTG